MNLSDYNGRWKTFLESDKCPPVLGLAPLSEEEAAEICGLIHAKLPTAPRQRFNALLSLLRLYPAAITVWLARLAGHAYDGNFWPNFERLIGVDIPTTARAEFVKTFRQCCFLVGITTIDPPQLSAFFHMKRLLFQAGMPLCHVAHFANAMRWVERQFSLPDPEEPGAGRDLCALMVRSPNLANIPILREALTGPAGPLICEVALRVALDAEPLEINPAIARAVKDAFEDVGHGTQDRPRAPFLRLAADFCSLEVVCPRQPASLVGPSGLVWVVCGVPQRVGANDETIFPVASHGHFTVELRGLVGGHNLRREFDLRWSELKQPFMVFDATTRCWHRVEEGEIIAIRSGPYWVLHSAESKFDAATRCWVWADGQSALSEVTLRPNQGFQLAANEQTFVFKTAQLPFFSPIGDSAYSDELDRLHYRWHNLPEVWCPIEDGAGFPSDWKLHIHSEDRDCTEPLLNGERIGTMVRCQPNGSEFLKALRPGLHFITLSVSRGNRRPQCKETFKLWVGLREYRDGGGFNCDELPFNIRPQNCLGLTMDGMAIKHSKDSRRQHVLAFEVGEEIVTFHFSRNGTFLESFEKRSGHAIQAEPCKFGSMFSASIQSSKCLRIWHIPSDDYRVLVNETPVQEIERCNRRLFCDLSLAELSTRFPSGGEIALDLRGVPFRIARFARPLVPCSATTHAEDDYESLVFKFADDVSWVRPRIRELISGRCLEFEGQKFESSGHCRFSSDGLPTIESANVSEEVNSEGLMCRVSLNVPKKGWPEGIWLVELEIRRDENSTWQLLNDEKDGGFPLALVFPPETSPSGFRALAYWWAFNDGIKGGLIPNTFPLQADIEITLCELMGEVSTLLSRGYNELAWQRLKGLERLFFELGRIAARLLEHSEVIVRNMLQAAGSESNLNPARSLFVVIPELFALSGEAYGGMFATDGLRDSLRWCARVHSHSRVADGFMDAMEQVIANPTGSLPGIFGVLRNFANSAIVMQPHKDERQAVDFRGFDFMRYRTQIVGPLKESDIDQAGWVELSPFDKLCRNHALHALHALRQRRLSENGQSCNQANSAFAKASDLLTWLQTRLGTRSVFVTPRTWMTPWLDIDFSSDALAENLNCYASMTALAARASAAGWLRFSEFLAWQTDRFGLEISMKATTTLVAMSPELFGFYLLLWELLIRTESYD